MKRSEIGAPGPISGSRCFQKKVRSFGVIETGSEEFQQLAEWKKRNQLLISADVIGFDDRDAGFSQIRDRFANPRL